MGARPKIIYWIKSQSFFSECWDIDILLFLLDFYLKGFYLRGELLAAILCPQMEALPGNGVYTEKLELG